VALAQAEISSPFGDMAGKHIMKYHVDLRLGVGAEEPSAIRASAKMNWVASDRVRMVNQVVGRLQCRSNERSFALGEPEFGTGRTRAPIYAHVDPS
jgi:hypothetical protein